MFLSGELFFVFFSVPFCLITIMLKYMSYVNESFNVTLIFQTIAISIGFGIPITKKKSVKLTEMCVISSYLMIFDSANLEYREKYLERK